MAQSLRQKREEARHKHTDHSIITLDLPVISKKVEEANKFLEDPRQLSNTSDNVDRF